MTDKWKEVGAELRARLSRERERQEMWSATPPPTVTGTVWEAFARSEGGSVSEFFRCVVACLDGDPSLLRAYKEAGKPLPASADAIFRDVVMETAGRPSPKKGRPYGLVRVAANGADQYYKMWQELNEREGVSNHGNRADMLDEAVSVVCEDYFPTLTAKERAAVRELLEAPRQRRAIAGI